MSMFIEKIEIKNYRSCKDSVFSPHANLSALIGPNGSGKTSILRSILIMKHLVHEDPMRRMKRVELDPTTIKLTLNVDGFKVIHTANLYIDNNERNQDEIVASEQKWYMKDVTGSAKLIRIPVSIFGDHGRYYGDFFDDKDDLFFYHPYKKWFHDEVLAPKNVLDIIKKVSSYYDGVTYYSASQFTDPTRCPVSIEVEDRRIRRVREFEGHRKWLLDLYSEFSRN